MVNNTAVARVHTERIPASGELASPDVGGYVALGAERFEEAFYDQESKFYDASDELDTLGLFYREVRRYPLLKPGEEHELGRLIALGHEARKALKETPCDDATRALLLARVNAGKRAWQRLVNCNLRLVVSIARKYTTSPLPLSDLIQHGTLGLMRAASLYDAEKGWRFSTYATPWIRQTITRGLINESRMIRLPSHVVEALHHLKRAAAQIEQETGREATPKELAVRLQKSEDAVRELLAISDHPVSLDTVINEDEDMYLLDAIADPASSENVEHTERQALCTEIERILSTLSPQEEFVIRRRFGIQNQTTQTLDQIARELGVSRERVRQIEQQAMRKLRNSINRKRLVVFLSN